MANYLYMIFGGIVCVTAFINIPLILLCRYNLHKALSLDQHCYVFFREIVILCSRPKFLDKDVCTNWEPAYFEKASKYHILKPVQLFQNQRSARTYILSR
jgi:hypothetical protein